MADENEWYFCLKHNTVEQAAGCRSAERMGPYPSADAASHALESAHERTEKWDTEDQAWNERGERS